MAVITMWEALNQALSEEMERDENVILLGRKWPSTKELIR